MCSLIRLINKTLTNLKKVCMVGWQVSITTDNLVFRVFARGRGGGGGGVG